MFEVEQATKLVLELNNRFERAKMMEQKIDQKEFKNLMKQMYYNYMVLLPPQDLSVCDQCGRSFDDSE